MMNDLKFKIVTTLIVACGMLSFVGADPCGMVPPIYTGQSPIKRIGLQKTYVFHKDGVESFVIRPGFQGNVDNFGMLIPFPTPPEIRKVSDDVFSHVTNAIDPPEVVVDLRIRRRMMMRGAGGRAPAQAAKGLKFDKKKSTLTVLKQEAVGMYQVAVLAAGSAEVLKKWMDKNGYKYPKGMDKVTEDYVKEGWCFVAVKTKVGQKAGVQPKPGAKGLKRNLPDGSVFDGNVQGMGFRFKSEKLVVPMRLSAFNEGDMRNVVYLLTDGPRKIRAIPEEYVVRQVAGADLVDNMTKPLPLRIIGGDEKDIPEYQRKTLPNRRKPEPKNGVAKDLFASDLLAVSTGKLSLRHEEDEKELLRIGEHFGLRGGAVDAENAIALKDKREVASTSGLKLLKEMTLTVVDGDFPREVIARDNLKFADYRMPRARNNNLNYDANRFGPGLAKSGVLKLGSIDWSKVEKASEYASANQLPPNPATAREFKLSMTSMLGIGVLGFVGLLFFRLPKTTSLLLAVGLMFASGLVAQTAYGSEPSEWQTTNDETLFDKLENSKTAAAAIKEIRELSRESDAKREEIVQGLLSIVKKDKVMAKRGWAIAALAEIGGQDVDEYLLNVHADEGQKKIVRTWAAAARVSMTRTTNGLIEKANLIPQFPALGRPIGIRIVEKLSSQKDDVNAEKVIGVTQKVPQLRQALAPMIMNFGADKLTTVMSSAKEQNIRRTAAAYLASLAQQGDGEPKKVAAAVAATLKFDADAKVVPWNGGPLFVPGIQWQKKEARELVGNLIRWYVWCDVRGKTAEMKQIHNNIRSLALARAAGYQSPGWRESGVESWLKAWGGVVGKDGLEKIFNDLKVGDKSKYTDVLKRL